MVTFTIHAAKTQLSQLVARAEAGEEIVLARGKVAVAKLVPLGAPASRRRFGAMRGQIEVTPAFFEPLDAQELGEWE